MLGKNECHVEVIFLYEKYVNKFVSLKSFENLFE
jgi:hypothetical protein